MTVRARRAVLASAGAALTGLVCLPPGHAAPTPRTQPNKHTVKIEGMKFVPEQLEVALGDIVVWTNMDVVPHTATQREGAWDSKTIATKKSWRYQAKKVGSFPYVCTLHWGMQGMLNVKP